MLKLTEVFLFEDRKITLDQLKSQFPEAYEKWNEDMETAAYHGGSSWVNVQGNIEKDSAEGYEFAVNGQGVLYSHPKGDPDYRFWWEPKGKDWVSELDEPMPGSRKLN